ncbi:glycine zipper 2TM domain-containing protein [Thiohalocapsa sp. ML1]|jgi:hypothetical protein|uniref:glycine zipper 2TM domain-containing protein n=1 Tax=Thiohalocapsa sp. ML1 TaxID=1431688 RepID=UPI001C1FBC26|nr:glycine zipper 2TM domain-containing protein [Thiohalocapsa sp. ML1]
MKSRFAMSASVAFMVAITSAGCVTTELGSTSPQNPKEEEIFLQAVMAGTAIGAAAGGAIGNQVAGKDERTQGTIIGAGIGGLVGNLAGREVARQQLLTYRNLRLSNDSMEQLLSSAKAYNRQVADYNKTLEREIASLERQGAAQRAELARANRDVAEKQRQGVLAQLNKRKQLAATLEQGQQREYRSTINTLQAEKDQLDAGIRRLDYIEERVKVGSRVLLPVERSPA